MKKVWAWFKKHWATVLGICGIVAGAFVAGKVVRSVVALLVDKVQRPATFVPDPSSPTKVLVKDGKTWVAAELPKGITNDKVAAAELTPQGDVHVQIAHPVTDRRDSPPAGPNAGLGVKPQ